jgi:SAM-dependent methyltransferase
MMGALGDTTRGVLGTVRGGNLAARVLAVGDSRAVVRSLFLAAAVRLDLLVTLREPRSFAYLAAHTGSAHDDQLEAFLAVGVELHEIRVRDGRYALRGRRAKAIAAGDRVLAAHYRSILDYQVGPYADVAALVRGDGGEGRDDLDVHAEVIAEVSRAAAPFVVPFLDSIVTELRPARALDVGCGTGVYVRAMLEADRTVHVDGIDLASSVVARSRELLAESGYEERVDLHVGDVRPWARETDARFGLISMLNNIYYFDPDERVALYRQLGRLLIDGGELVIVTMIRPGSIASAHLHFMLTVQAGSSALPSAGTVETDLRAAGFEVRHARVLVPQEPFVGIRARVVRP